MAEAFRRAIEAGYDAAPDDKYFGAGNTEVAMDVLLASKPVAALRTAIRAALDKRGEVSAASSASARALGGDGEPVAWLVVCRDGVTPGIAYLSRESAEEHIGVGETIRPLYTRPAATGDTGEVERARADFLAWVNAGYLVRDAVTDVEWDDEGLPVYYTRNDGERHYLDGEWHAWLAAKGVNCG